jgi:ferredoxin--NADP+ reductase
VDLEVDTMIFAIGDVADPTVGLPYNRDAYVTNPVVGEDAKGAPHYQLFDPQTGNVLQGMYAVGWARKASEGLVGIARHDGEVGAAHVLKYLESGGGQGASVEHVREYLERKGVRLIDKSDLELLARAEEKIARERGLPWFKFDKDEEMLAAIDAHRAKTVSV